MADVQQKIVALVSGGLDSTTMLYDIIDSGFQISSVVMFNYGQRHKKELYFAFNTAVDLGLKSFVIDLHKAGFTQAIEISGSSLVSDTPVPEGHYAEENMKATVVPNRNMVMLSIAGAIAVAQDAIGVATAVHAGDHFIYPDCRPDFIAHTSEALRVGNEGFGSIQGVYAPFIHKTKADIAFRALELGIDFSKTWSCYKGGDFHCGVCGTCVERLEAIDEAAARRGKAREQVDSTKYVDSESWKSTIAKGV